MAPWFSEGGVGKVQQVFIQNILMDSLWGPSGRFIDYKPHFDMHVNPPTIIKIFEIPKPETSGYLNITDLQGL